jgi:hypothetical protein
MRETGDNSAELEITAEPVIHRRGIFNKIFKDICWDVIVWINLVERQWKSGG